MNNIKGMSEKTRALFEQFVSEVQKESFAAGYEAGKSSIKSVEEEKTPNQQRAELIAKAKGFVEIKSKAVRDSTELKLEGGYVFKEKENPNFHVYALKVEFFTNIKKRTVVALLKPYGSKSIQSKGIAKCMPTDVFNEHIGQAIALARALKIDIPVEFLQAVQPSEKVVGMVVKHKKTNSEMKLVEREKFNSNENVAVINSLFDQISNISDDTNAHYEVAR